GYGIDQASATSVSDRPAYGKNCYSPLLLGQTFTVTAYNSVSVTATIMWSAYTTGENAYAHVIDGFAADQAVLSTTTTASNTPPTTASITPNTTSSGTTAAVSTTSAQGSSMSEGLSRGAIAGIVIGAIAAVIILLAASFFALRHRRRRHHPVELDSPERVIDNRVDTTSSGSNMGFKANEKPGELSAASERQEMAQPVAELEEYGRLGR
ncbi:hypothetical protein LTR66_004649, partial [Elasticomyces elasticus]